MINTIKFIFSLSCLLLLLAACSAGGANMPSVQLTPVTPSVPLSEELLAFCGSPGGLGNADIHLVFADGSNLTAVQQTRYPRPVDDGCEVIGNDVKSGLYLPLGLTWSSTGETLIFSTWQVPFSVEVTSDGRPGTPVDMWIRVNEFDHPLFPSISPDGRRLAVKAESRVEMGFVNAWTVDLDGSDPLEMSQIRRIPQAAMEPVWSPDGQWIAFTLSAPLSGAGVVSRDGAQSHWLSNETLPALLHEAVYDLDVLPPNYAPSWYPDSKRVIFIGAQKDGQSSALFRFDSVSGQVTELISENVYSPVLSPQGTALAYVSYFNESNRASAVIMLADGDGQSAVELLRVSQPEGSGTTVRDLAWSSDGTRLAFASNHEGDMDIYVVNADGRGLVNVTQQPGLEVMPRWRPRPDRAAVETSP